MKLYLLCDMEGISGIRKMEQVKRAEPDYAEGRRLMMAEINVAVAACFQHGATEVVVCDTHGGGGQLELDKMDPRATYETPNNGDMMPALDESFAGVMLLGHHAKAGTIDGFLDHTMSSESWFRCLLNGVEVGEIGLEAAYAGHYGVPVILVSGDEKTSMEAKELLGNVETPVVKWGVGRNRARCLSPEKAHDEIRQAIAEALSDLSRFRPYCPSVPATLTLTLYRSDMAESFCRPCVTRVDARTVERTVDCLLDIQRW